MIQLYILVPVLLFFLLHAKVETKFTLMLSCARVMRRCARRLRSREFFLHGVVYRSNYVVYVVFFFFSCSVVYWSIFFSCGVMCLSIFFFFSFFHVALYVGRILLLFLLTFILVMFVLVMWICL